MNWQNHPTQQQRHAMTAALDDHAKDISKKENVPYAEALKLAIERFPNTAAIATDISLKR